MDILELIHQNEGKTFEVKQDISSPDKILRTITAFANTAGGILIIGVEDETRKVIGVENCQALEETLSNLIFDSISPPISPNFEPVAIDTKKLLIVHVFF